MYTTGASSPTIFAAADGTTATFTLLSIQEIQGNHAYQSTSAARPTLRALARKGFGTLNYQSGLGRRKVVESLTLNDRGTAWIASWTSSSSRTRSRTKSAPRRASSARASMPPRRRPGWERTRRQLQGDLDNVLLKALIQLGNSK